MLIKFTLTPTLPIFYLRGVLRDVRGPDRGHTKVVEKGGTSIQRGVINPDLYRLKGCPYAEKCLINPKQSCWTSKMVYSVACTICGAEYRGTSGLSAHKCGLEYLHALRRKDASYGITKHFLAKHPTW